MERLSTLFLFLVIASHFGITPLFAQKFTKPREVIVIEISVPKFIEVDKREVLINRNPKSKYEIGGNVGQAGSEVENSFYWFTIRAFKMGEDKAKISFEIEVDERCKTRKVFMVYRNQQNKTQLDCGISLAAYYGFESEEAN